MENAAKALIMAGGILLGILLLSLMVALFAGTKSASSRYEETKRADAIHQFNVNITKYLGQELTIHQVVTICNYAKEHGINVVKNGTNINYNQNHIDSDINDYTTTSIKKYNIQKVEYNSDGYINLVVIE